MTLEQPADATELEHLTLHALNNFDIPVGMMTGVAATGVEQDDQTKWVSIASLSARRYIVRIQSNPTPVVVDLASLDLTGDAPRQLDLLPGEFTPVTL
ncbi:hypothetical protein [Agromyces atrinae]|uniref:Penicillin V acylase-like amidase (Ntn superfamily) n=1 Tax=Agromyces atrinae TaxID=592376 RepID=A0A4Q2M0U4_9MICO|nr:hypothetical protein [Agromyces atrinae]NYD65666.1 penicillin V acylase-like amidase (Ntn superfamily) [Agromyces atrinae]RXZ85464.1 hypothetical protein ESP50_14765 [Agromyces atrinae]